MQRFFDLVVMAVCAWLLYSVAELSFWIVLLILLAISFMLGAVKIKVSKF